MISVAFHITDVRHPQNKLGKPESTSTTQSKQKKTNTKHLLVINDHDLIVSQKRSPKANL